MIFILFMCVMASSVWADISVIVHPSNSSTVPAQEVSKIFLGKQSSFSGGGEAVPINLTEGNATRETFNTEVLGKNARQIKAYWSKLVFTGKGTPPKEVDSADDMLELISNNPNMIGYIDSSKVTGAVKVVHQF